MVRPLTDIVSRAATALPLGGIGLLAAGMVLLGLRVIDLFFSSAARNETVIPYVAAHLARPVGALLKLGLVLGALLFAAPIITGNDDGALPRSAVVALGTLGLASTPLLASLAMGVAVIFSGQLKIGDHAVFGGQRGRVRSVGLLFVVLEAGPGVETRVPQLLALFHPTQTFGPLLRVAVELPLATFGSAAEDALKRAALSVGTQPEIEIIAIERRGSRYRISVLTDRRDARTALLGQCARELSEAGIELGSGSDAAREGQFS
jgi:small-conductance mechanosensitive channel